MAEAKRDGNYVPTILGVSSSDATTPVPVYVDPTTHRMLVSVVSGGTVTVDAGTTTTGAPGTNASVVNSGTTTNAVFDFTIPRGATGATGATGPAGSSAVIYDTSVTSNTIGTGSKTFSVTSSTNSWVSGDWLIISSQANAGNYMTGYITSYSGTSVTVTVVATGGSGTHTDWNLITSGVKGTDGAGAGDVLGPATNTDSYIPQWNGANSKTLKDGLAVPAGGLAGLTEVGTKMTKLNPTTLKTGNYTANVDEYVPCDISSSSFTITLPTAPADKSQIEILIVKTAADKVLTIQAGGTDKFDRTDGPQTIYMYLAIESLVCTYQSSTGIWFLQSAAAPFNFATGFPGIDSMTPITNADISIDTSTRELTISTSRGYFDFFVDGGGKITRYRKNGAVIFPAFTDTSGTWYFYFDSTGTAVTTQTAWTTIDFPTIAPVYRIVWNKELFNFTVTAATATAGDTYTNNSSTFTVLESISGGTTLKCKRTTGTNNPTASGNLTRATGAGTDPIVFSAFSEAPKLVAQYIEYHLNDISADDHQWFHLQGTQWIKGGTMVNNALTSGSPNADGRNSVIALTTISNVDDNLEYTITNSTGGNPWQQDLGNTTAASLNATNSGLFKIFIQDSSTRVSFLSASRFPFAFNASTNVPQYITSTGTRTDVTSTNFFVYFVYATQNPVAGEAIKTISATSEFTTITNARAFNWVDIQNTYSIIANDPEIRPLYRLIFETRSSGGGAYDVGAKFSVLRETQDLRKAAVTSTTVSTGSIPASSVTVVPAGNIASTNVQSALEELDTEKAPATSPTFATSITGSYLTASEILVTDGSKNIVSAPVATYPSLTELSYVKGVTSSIQTQINAKGVGDMTLAGVQSVTGAKTFDKDKVLMKGTSTGVTTFSTANTSASNYTQTFPAQTGTVANVTGTSDTITVGTIELGAATDTTIARVSAGVASIEGKNIALNGTGETLTTGSIELGAASDTTIARVSAGVVSIEGSNIMTVGSTDTVTGTKTMSAITLPTNGQISLTVPTTDGHATGFVTSAFNSGYSNTAVGDLVYLDSSATWQKTDADSTTTAYGLIGIALEVKASGNAVKVALPGSFVRIDAWNWTPGVTLYLGETAGAIQTAIPTGADNVIRVVGFAVNADYIYFYPSQDVQLTVA